LKIIRLISIYNEKDIINEHANRNVWIYSMM
jgi:hypothetical protein